MSTCCSNKIVCALLLSCLGMGLCLEDGRELGIKEKGKKRHLSAPYVNLKVAEALAKPRPSAFGRAPSPVAPGWAVAWISLEGGGGRSSPVGECPVPLSSVPGRGGPILACCGTGAGWMDAVDRLLPAGIMGTAVGSGNQRMGQDFHCFAFLVCL